jgi:foldase protein PrsA
MKNRITVGIIYLLLAIFIPGINAEDKKSATDSRWAFISENVADVNGIKITKNDLITYMKNSSDPKSFYSFSGKALEDYTHEMLNNLINQILLAKIAESNGFKAGFDLIKSETDKMVAEMQPKEKADFMKYLESKKMNLDDFCRSRAKDKFAARQLAIETWFNNDIKKGIKVTEKEIEKFYTEAEDTVSASQILIKYDGNSPEAKAKAKKHAEEILAKIKAGGDFRKFASTESCCGSNADGLAGSLGEFARGQMVQEFEDAAFSLPVGGISDVVETPFGFHIIKVDKKGKRPLPPLAQIKEKIKDEIKKIKAQDKIIELLKQKKKECKIDVTGFKGK